jgi:Acyclic terpene utilisation family protein AtuA
LEPALLDLAKYHIKVVVNAGASDTKGLHDQVQSMVSKMGLTLKVAWIGGDEILHTVKSYSASNESLFENICTGEKLNEWKFEPMYAQCYLGGMGIAAALENGADIVVCGRVSDASPVIGASVWWNGWNAKNLDCLANAFIAGHLIECSNYVCGGNFTGFKQLETKGWTDIGYPIAEIDQSGAVVITKQQGTGGEVSIDTCKAQLLYEIQGPWYYNSDVTALLPDIYFEQVGIDRVRVRGVAGDAPPPTTKIGITAKGGFQVELHYALVGLDIDAKARMLEAQIRGEMGTKIDRYSVLDFTTNGCPAEDPDDQNAATVDFRILAQALDSKDLEVENFLRPVIDSIMQSYPGATFHYDFRTGVPKPIYEYFVTLLPQSAIKHVVNLPGERVLEIPPPEKTKVYPAQQPSTCTAPGVNLSSFGETVRGPLGWVVHARSGDKGSNANVGFWVRNADEWAWLRTILSVEKVKLILGKEYKGGKIVSI